MTTNTFKIGDKVDYNGNIATVVDMAEPFLDYPAVVVEYKGIFSDFGPSWQQIDRRTVIEYGLKLIEEA